MGMKPDEFLQAFVDGNLQDCRQEPGDLRRAFNAAVSAAHLADNYYNYYARHKPALVARFPKVGAFVEYLAEETDGAFRDIRSIANAYKHLYTNPGHLVHSTILSGGALASVFSSEDNAEIENLDDRYEEGPDGRCGRAQAAHTR